MIKYLETTSKMYYDPWTFCAPWQRDKTNKDKITKDRTTFTSYFWRYFLVTFKNGLLSCWIGIENNTGQDKYEQAVWLHHALPHPSNQNLSLEVTWSSFLVIIKYFSRENSLIIFHLNGKYFPIKPFCSWWKKKKRM